MDWRKKLDDTKTVFQFSRYFMADEAAIARKEVYLTDHDFKALITKVFIPAVEEFQAEMKKRGRVCETDREKSSITLRVSHEDELEMHVGFAAVGSQLAQLIVTPMLSGTFRFDTKVGKITTDDVLNYLAEFYAGTRIRDDD